MDVKCEVLSVTTIRKSMSLKVTGSGEYTAGQTVFLSLKMSGKKLRKRLSFATYFDEEK